MQLDQATAKATTTDEAFLAGLLNGYRFRVCQSPEDAERALDVRRAVYVNASGYRLPVPDQYDARSWFLLAEDTWTGEAVGSMRLTPRGAGPLEAEEYFRLPASLRNAATVELNRFAILPAYRKGKTFLPVVSLGLFKLVRRYLQQAGARYMVIASKPERVWTYEWMRFERTGLIEKYAKLDYAEHELLSYDFERASEILRGHPFEAFFESIEYREVVLPSTIPSLGIGVERAELLRRSA
jgi:N-acyl-L-homoserine lactone synthetase